ncbi:MAG: putative photosynthetic complex assembly protein PuhE [Pseudomonadota bacterium]
MAEIATALGFALFLWWAGTGGILVAVGLPRRALAGVMALSLPLLSGAVIAFGWAAQETSLAGVYVAFSAAIAIWGWHEFAFLTGAITGPRRSPCPSEAGGWQRFRFAVEALAWHELALLLTAVLLGALSWNEPNQFGLWTFLTLFFARISAKLNLFLGVPNLAAELIPESLDHLKSYFRDRPMNLMFPISITALSCAVGGWGERAYAAQTMESTVGFALLGMLTLLALIEHWLLVLPLRDAALWRWMLPSRDARRRSTLTTDRV